MSGTSQHLDLPLTDGSTLRVAAITPFVYRVRRGDGRFAEPGMVRYGIVRSDWPEVAWTVRADGAGTVLDAGSTSLAIGRDGAVALRDGSGRALVAAEPAAGEAEGGFRAAFALAPDERLYGLGDETRDRLNKRGHATPMVLRNVVSYAPIPFLMSTGGWAVFLNTTWFHHVDAGQGDPDRLVFTARRGELDYYLIAGDSLPVLLDRYTALTGRPALLPLWAYGLTYVCDERGVRARDVLYEAHTFRREGLPLDGVGLEPSWMEQRYDFSVDKQWSEERFHQPTWKPHQNPGGFSAALSNMGFKLSLWLCCDYDLSEHEERLLGAAATDEADDAPPADDRYDEDVIRDPHFLPTWQDKLTRPGQPWFEHLKKFVDNGASAFKMDGANQVCFHPDRKWFNGMTDEEMHNLYPLLLGKQMSHGFRDYTGHRAMIYTAGGYAGIQQYAATWAGDTGGDQKPLVSILNHGLSGHSNTSCDMQVWNAAGIHFGFLQPWSQILGWHQYNQPWFLPEDVYAMFRFYAKLRYRLLPYLYSAAHVAARTGLPMMRAMPLAAPDDPRSDELLWQYLLGESLLTAAFTDTIHLPAGRWIDYWTGAAHDGPKDLDATPPAGRGGPLFVRAGALIPTWPDMAYVGQAPIDTLGLEVFPHGESAFTLYEDDGLTCAYLDGKVATTALTCAAADDALALTIGPRQGSYDGMPERRAWDLTIHLADQPAGVTVDGQPLAAGSAGWRHDPAAGTLHLRLAADPARPRVVEVRR